MLKRCKICKSKYGILNDFLFTCEHHTLEQKDFPLPADFKTVRGLLHTEQLTYKEVLKKYGDLYNVPKGEK